jgi:histone H2A
MLKTKSYKTYIHRILKQQQPETNISKSAIECVDSVLRTIASRISSDAHLFTQGTNKKTLSSREVQTAVKSVFTGKMTTFAVKAGFNSVQKYSESVAAQPTPVANVAVKPVMREARAGLVMSVSLAEKYLRGFGQIKYNISAGASVYLAAVLDYLTCEIAELAGKVCKDMKRTTINVRHLYLGITNDAELNELIKSSNIVILGGGIQPGVNESLLVKKTTKRKKGPKNPNDGVKKHRWRPGTVALREIHSYQKTFNLLIQRTPFERLVRTICKPLQVKTRFTKPFMEAFQYLIENDVIEMLKTANELCLHAGRETVSVEDINLTVKIRQLPCDVVETTELPTAAVSKLAYRSGIKRMGGDAKTRVKLFITNIVTQYMKRILLCADHNRRQTINTKFLLEGLATLGIHVATIPQKRKVGGKKVKGDVSETGSVYSAKNEEDEEDEEDEEKEEEEEADEVEKNVAVNKATIKDVTHLGSDEDSEEEENILDDINEDNSDSLTDE